MQQINEDRRTYLLSLSNRLDDIAVERGALLLRLESLESQERALKRECASLHNLDAPTSNCPDEILAMIFEAGMPGRLDILQGFGQGSKHPDFGVIASHVSQRWRSIALATPKLWAYIQCFRYSLDKRKARNRWRERAVVWLSRSRSSPVYIHIDGSSLDIDRFTRAAEFVDLISDHMGHCRQLRIEYVRKEIMPMLLESLSRQPVPILRSITLNRDTSMEPQNLFSYIGLPRLTTFELTGMPPLTTVQLKRMDPLIFTPAFASVTSLRIDDLNIYDQEQYDSFRDTLMNMSVLSHLELELVIMGTIGVQPTLLPSLRLLAVDMELHSQRLSTIVKSIHAPSLVSLSLTGWDPVQESPDSSVVGETHFPVLKHLIIYSIYRRTLPEFELLAKAFPNIERFTCTVDEDIRDIIYNITEPADELRWPKLQGIAMSKAVRTLNADQLDDLCQLIVKLQQAGRPFRQLLYPTSGSCDALTGAGDIHKLKELVELEDFRDDWPKLLEWAI